MSVATPDDLLSDPLKRLGALPRFTRAILGYHLLRRRHSDMIKMEDPDVTRIMRAIVRARAVLPEPDAPIRITKGMLSPMQRSDR
jgi:hypothetical protein